MLLRFSVRNFLSIGEKEELILTSTPLADREEGLIDIPNQRFKILPSAVIYGANASGKSNFLHAFKFLRSGILESHRRIEAKINRRQFLLGEVPDGETSSFEVDFILPALNRGDSVEEHIRMTYGFVISDTEVVEEWLYAYPKQHRQIWFHRNINEDNVYYFGSALKGQNKIISSNTRAASLFLSTAFANNHAQLTPVFEYFKNILFRLDGLDSKKDQAVTTFIENDQLRGKIVEFLKNADVGICTATVKEITQSKKVSTIVSELKSVLTKHFPKEIEEQIELPNQDGEKEIRLGHQGKDKLVELPLTYESRGTVAFLNLIGWVILALDTGSLMVVDELDSSLHPLLCRKILELFNCRTSNPNGAQLIFSTHDTSLISMDLMRRDQVWFAEKNDYGCTKIYPLSDLKLRKTDNFQRGYLEGKFGAIPYLGDFTRLCGSNT